MKIYCLLLDTMPYCKTAERLQRIVGSNLTRQVSGCFTMTSLISMFTGELTSNLMPGGLGYEYHHNTFGQGNVCRWSWRHKLIQFYLKTKGFRFISRHHQDIIELILGFKDYPELHTDESYFKNGKDAGYVDCLKNRRNSYKIDEFKYIKKIQQPIKENIFYFIDYNYYHAAVQLKEVRQKKWTGLAAR